MAPDMQARADKLARNPHNFHDSRFGGGMSPAEFWRAKFELEGRQGRDGQRNPYAQGTMAGVYWQAGRDAAA